MLYRVFDTNQKLIGPFRKIFKEIKNKLDVMATKNINLAAQYRFLASFFDIFERSTRRSEKTKFNLNAIEVNGIKVKIQEEVVIDKPFCNLLHFKKDNNANEPKVLIIAPVSGHYATLLKDTAKAMVASHDTYITDWKNAREVPVSDGNFDLDEYTSYLIEFIRKIGTNVHVMAVCQPVVQASAAVAIMNKNNDPCIPASMILIGGPVDPRVNRTDVNKLSERYSLERFAKTMLYRVPPGNLGEGRLVYPGFLQISAFISMNPDNHFNAHVKYQVDYTHNNVEAAAKHASFYDEYLTVMDMDATYFLETIEKIFQKHELAKGTLKYRGQSVNLADIKKTALLILEGEHDDISAPGQCLAAYSLCKNLPSNMKMSYLQKGVGHYGIFSGSKWRGQVYPIVQDFIRKHSKRLD